MKNLNLTKLLSETRNSLKSGNYEMARSHCTEILSKFPLHEEALVFLVTADVSLGKLEEAWDIVANRVSKLGEKAGFQQLHSLLTNMHESGSTLLMEKCARWLTEARPKDAFAWDALAIALIEQRNFADAIQASKQAAELLPDNARIQANLGAGLNGAKMYTDARLHLEKAVSLDPNLANAHNNLGNALNALNQKREAIACYQRAIAINPRCFFYYFNMGDVFHELKEYTEAESAYRQSLQINPLDLSSAGALIDVLNITGRVQEAVWLAEKYIEPKPGNSKFWAAYGNVLQKTGLIDRAIDAYLNSLQFESNPQSSFSRKVYSSLLFVLNNHPDLSAEVIFGAYREYEQKFGLPFYDGWTKFSADLNPNRKIRVGYLSQAFFNHVCRYFLTPLMEQFDREQFEIVVYDDSPVSDHVTEFYKKHADFWQPVSGWSDDDICLKIKQDKIDILIDISGHSTENRLCVFARKPAPVSLHWLDFGYTTGLRAIDYYLTDAPGAPEGSDYLFAEKVWRLDVPAFVYRPEASSVMSGEPPFLKNNGVITFGCLSRANRINHKVVRVWSAILDAMPNSRLLISSGDFGDPEMREQMIGRFVAEGIDRSRLDIGYSSPSYIPLQNIDISLDCFPHNSGTTLIESLYMGVPFISLAGRPSVGRIGSSVLHAAGFAEWIAENEMEYAQKVLMLAHDQEKLIYYRQNLRDIVKNSPLMDETGFARGFERALRQMWQRYCEQEGV